MQHIFSQIIDSHTYFPQRFIDNSLAKVALGNKTKIVFLANKVFGQKFTRSFVFITQFLWGQDKP